MGELNQLTQEHYAESTQIMQLLRDNLTLWSADLEGTCSHARAYVRAWGWGLIEGGGLWFVVCSTSGAATSAMIPSPGGVTS